LSLKRVLNRLNQLSGRRGEGELFIVVLEGGLNSRSKLLPIKKVPSGFLGGALASLSGRSYEEGR
jgi:hypothetical protein